MAKELKYTVRYEGNNSKRWDGREILLDGEWLESLYPKEDLTPGKIVNLPWQTKGGVKVWTAVLVKPDTEAAVPKTKGRSIIIIITTYIVNNKILQAMNSCNFCTLLQRKGKQASGNHQLQ
jgi:hypothetical protein